MEAVAGRQIPIESKHIFIIKVEREREGHATVKCYVQYTYHHCFAPAKHWVIIHALGLERDISVFFSSIL